MSFTPPPPTAMATPPPPTWLITGTSNGLGLSLSRLVLSQGHTLISLSRHPGPHEKLLSLSQSHSKNATTSTTSDPSQNQDPARLHHLQHDLSDPNPNTIKSLISHFLKSHPDISIDFLVNNAAITAFAPLETIPTSTVQKVMTINFYSPLWLIQACLPNIRAGSERERAANSEVGRAISSEVGNRAIVNISSTQGLACDASELAYDASKHALEALSGVLAKEVSPWGIRVINANLGSFRSGFAMSSQQIGLNSTSTSTGEGKGQDTGTREGQDEDGNEHDVWRPPYDDPEHPATKRVNMVMKYARIPHAAKGHTDKGAEILFDAITCRAGSAADEALGKQREYIAEGGKVSTSRVERLLIGSDGWPKIRAAADQLSFQIETCKTVAKLSDAE